MSDEFKVVVNQESRGNAVADVTAKVEQLKARIAELNRLEQNYAQKGITGTGDLTKERTALQRELSTIERDQARSARERHEAERGVTREQREQHAVRNSRLRALGHGVNAFEGAAGVGGVSGMAGMATNPVALVATAVGAYAGRLVAEAMDKAIAISQSEGRTMEGARRTARIMGRANALEGERDATQQYQSNRSALGAAQDRQGTFRDTDKLDFFKRLLGFETSGQRGERENDLEISRLEKEVARDKALAQEKFTKGEGGAELEMKKALLNYDMRSVRALQDKVTGLKEYDRVFTATGSKELANQAANDAVQLQQRDRAGKLAGLINARDGMGDVARVAALAGDVNGGQVWSRKIFDTMKQQHEDVKIGPLKDWSVGR